MSPVAQRALVLDALSYQLVTGAVEFVRDGNVAHLPRPYREPVARLVGKVEHWDRFDAARVLGAAS